MAAAEARAAWQRTANRYLVQEDAKRAPKLACCQSSTSSSSSSSSSSKQIDSGPTDSADVPDHQATGFMPLHKNSFSTLPTDTRWWKQMQANGFQNGMTTYEQPKASNATSENLALNEAQKQRNDSVYTSDHNGDGSSFHACTKNAVEVEKREGEPLYGRLPREFVEVVDVTENYEFIDMDAFKPVSKHSSEFEMDLDSPWIRIEKALPWWQTTDIDDIASLVSQRTYEFIENCDLPPMQNLCFTKHPSDAGHMSKFDLSATVCGRELQRQQKVLEGNLGDCSEKSFRYNQNINLKLSNAFAYKSPLLCPKSCNKDIPEARKFSEGDACKAELMEALRHSQTRAREAEKAAEQANAEKEHIIQLFFKQASQLFACRQWLQLLQLDQPFCTQMKNNEQPFSYLFPLTLPWTSGKSRKERKNTPKRRAKHSRPRHDIGKYAAAFVLGLSLIGAGLLLGWTVGWMLPPF